MKHLKTFESFKTNEEISLPFMKAKKSDLMKELTEETEFLASHKDADKVRELYKDYKDNKNINALRKANSILRNYAETELNKTSKAAGDFQKNVYRIIEDRVEELGDKPIGGRGAASAST
jgi:hypothetical protein